MYEQDLLLNNLQWLICHETKLNEWQIRNCNNKFETIIYRFIRLFFGERLFYLLISYFILFYFLPFISKKVVYFSKYNFPFSQSAKAVEYADCFSAKG